MAGLSPYAAAPPPPPIGGNRKSKQIVGGTTSNVGYAAGADLQNARTAYQVNQQMGQPQNALQRGFFQGASQAADFTQSQTNQMQANQNLTAGQAQGRQMQQNTLGQVRAVNAPNGLGYGRSNALGIVRQHTISGNEALDPSMTYTAKPTPPPPPVVPPKPATNTTTTTTTPKPNPTPTQPVGGTVGTVAPGTPAPTYSNGFSTDMFKWQNLNVWSIPQGRYVAKDINQMTQQEVFNALANGQNNGALADGYYLADANSIKKGTPPPTTTTPAAPTPAAPTPAAPTPTAPAPAPTPTAPAPTPAAPAPTGPAPAPAPTISGAQAVRQQYAGTLTKGTRIYGSDGMQRIVQYMGVSPSGSGKYVPWVNRPGGGFMVHPDWQGI